MAMGIYSEILPEQIIRETRCLAFRALSVIAPKSWAAYRFKKKWFFLKMWREKVAIWYRSLNMNYLLQKKQ